MLTAHPIGCTVYTMTRTQQPTEHLSLRPSGNVGDTRIIRDGGHRITQVRTVDGWWNIKVENG